MRHFRPGKRREAVRQRFVSPSHPLCRMCEGMLSHAFLYWSAVGIFLLLCLQPVIVMAVTKVWPEPHVLWTLPAACTGVLSLLGAVYMLHPLPPSPGWMFSRQVMSDLAEAEVILADTAMVTQGKRVVCCVTQPFAPSAPQKSPGSLSLAAAITYTIDRYDGPEAQALLEAADQMGLNRTNLLRFRPVEGETLLGTLSGAVVHDGKRRMAYFTGGAGDLSDLCGGVLDGTVRPMTEEDRARIRDVMLEMSQQGCRVTAFACSDDTAEVAAPIFLGMAALTDFVNEDAAQAIAALQAEGLTVSVQPVSQAYVPPLRLSALRSRLNVTDEGYDPQVIISQELLDTRAMGISPVDDRHFRLDAPVLLAREWFSAVENWLRLTLWCAAGPLAACVAGPVFPWWCLAAVLLLLPALATASYRCLTPVRAMLFPCISAAVTRLFLALAAPEAAGAAMTLWMVTTAASLALVHSGRWQARLISAGVAAVLAVCAIWTLPPVTAAFAAVAALLGALPFLRLTRA